MAVTPVLLMSLLAYGLLGVIYDVMSFFFIIIIIFQYSYIDVAFIGERERANIVVQMAGDSVYIYIPPHVAVE